MASLADQLKLPIGKLSFEWLVNIWLVAKDVRPGTTVSISELSEYQDHNRLKYLLDFAESLELKYKLITDNCYLIGKKKVIDEFDVNVDSTANLGEALGYQCYDHLHFGDHKRDRFCKTITMRHNNQEASITEVADAKLITSDELLDDAVKKIEAIKKVLPGYFEVFAKIEFIPSVLERLEKLKDREYVLENMEEYYSDLWNHCELIKLGEFERIVNNTEEYNKYLPLLEFVYKQYVCV